MHSQIAYVSCVCAFLAQPAYAQSASDYICQERGLDDMPKSMLSDPDYLSLVPEVAYILSLSSTAIPFAHVCGVNTERFTQALSETLYHLECSQEAILSKLVANTIKVDETVTYKAKVFYDYAASQKERRAEICARFDGIDLSTVDRSSLEGLRGFTGEVSQIYLDLRQLGYEARNFEIGTPNE